MKLPETHKENDKLSALKMNRTRQVMWQDIQSKAHPKGAYFGLNWLNPAFFKRTASAFSLALILWFGFSAAHEDFSPAANADYTLSYDDGLSSGTTPRFILESKSELNSATINEELDFFPLVDYKIERIDENSLAIIPLESLSESLEYKISLPAENHEWTYGGKGKKNKTVKVSNTIEPTIEPRIEATPEPVQAELPAVEELPAPVQLPDLMIEKYLIDAENGTLNLRIRNNSSVDKLKEADAQISIYLDGKSRVFQWSALTNKVQISTALYEVSLEIEIPVGRKITVCVDSANDIEESNENNNCVTTSVGAL